MSDDVTLAELGPRASDATLALRRMRARLGLTQAQMAAVLGVKYSTYFQKEQGLLPVQETLPLLARSLLEGAERQAKRGAAHPPVPAVHGEERGAPGVPKSDAMRRNLRATLKARRRGQQGAPPSAGGEQTPPQTER